MLSLSETSVSTSSGAGAGAGAGLDAPMENDWEYVHGRVDPGNDDNIRLIAEVEVEESKKNEEGHRTMTLLLPSDHENGESSDGMAQCKTLHGPHRVQTSKGTNLLALPSELIDYVLSFLAPIDLVSLSSTCRLIAAHAKSDQSWKRHVQESIPGMHLTSPSPYKTYRELYISHDPHWFLTKYKVWFSDYLFTGKIIITRYDPSRGCIVGYRLVAERPPPTFDPWEVDDEVIIHSFAPQCSLHLHQPVLQLDALSPGLHTPSIKAENRFCSEKPMTIENLNQQGVFSSFLFTHPVPERPNMCLWPPPIIPARQRVRNDSQEAFVGIGHKPQKRSEVSDQTFRIRRWMEMPPRARDGPAVSRGEEVSTYATLDPKLYTPTEEKPYRGIWVGDYSGHGCEFLLMNQPDNASPFDESTVIQSEGETLEEWEARKKEERIYRGSLEAIKLTGDPNIPRGQYTFIADDISKTSYIRTADEKQFEGARIVKSRGHIAARAFRDDKYIESQLIMISHNRLAQYWVAFGHISFYERVNINEFIAPSRYQIE